MFKLKLVKLPRFTLPLILMSITFLVYANTLSHAFVWDDPKFVLEWQTPKLGLSGLLPILMGDSPIGHEGIYRPLRGFYYLLSYRFLGENPNLYHAQAILIHLFGTSAVYLILLVLFKRKLPAFAGALVFGLHPIHVESVTWVTSSFDTFGQTLALWAFYSYLRRWRVISFIFAGLAIFSHETATLIPVYLMLYDYVVQRKLKFKTYLPYWLLASSYWLIRIPLLHISSRQPYPFGNLFSILWYMGKIVLKYFWNLVFPLNLTVNHHLDNGIQALYWADLNYFSPPHPPLFSDPVLILSWIFIILLLIFAFRLVRHVRLPAFAIFWIFVSLIPFMQIFPISALYNERYLYPASFGLSVFIAWLAAVCTKRHSVVSKRFFYSLFLFLIIFYGFKTIIRNQAWRNDLALWQQAIQANSYSNSNLTNLANAYFKQQNLNSAKYWYQQSLDLNKSQAINYTNLGIIAYNQNDKKAAKQYFQEAAALNPPSHIAHLYLGIIYHQEQNYLAAKTEYETFIAIYPRYPDTYLYLGMMAHEQKQFEVALQYYQKALTLKPKYADAYNNIGNLYRDEGNLAEAVNAYDMALQLDPKHPYAAKNLADVLKLNNN